MFACFPRKNRDNSNQKKKMQSKAMTETTYTLEQLITDLHEIDVSSKPARGWKKMDSSDSEIGTLSPMMQKLWLLRDRYYQILVDGAQQIEDQVIVHDTEHEQKGDRVPRESCEKYEKKIEALLRDLFVPRVLFGATDELFDSMIALEFPADPTHDMKVVGIREGFKVIRRKNNARGDHNHPLKSLEELLEKRSADRFRRLFTTLESVLEGAAEKTTTEPVKN
jgi:hypothetical protein